MPDLKQLTIKTTDGRPYRMKRNGRAQSLINVIKDNLDISERLDVVEIGVGAGYTSVSLLWAFPTLHLAMVDPYEIHKEMRPHEKNQKFLRSKLESATHLTAKYGRKIQILARSQDAARYFRDGHFDCVYVDALHGYEDVRLDLHAWWPKLREGGVFAGDNYDGRWDKRGIWGVKRAVDEFADQNRYEVNFENHVRSEQYGGLWWWVK